MAQARLIPGLVILLAVGGCGGPSYKASPASPISAGMENDSSRHIAPATGGAGQVSVLAEPYSDLDRQKAVFDADFTKAGILALQLRVHNTTAQAAQVRRDDMTLTLPGGQHLSPISATSAANLIEEKTGTSVAAEDVFFELLLGLNVQPARDQRRAEASRAKRVADYEAKEFGDAGLAPGGSASGFVFFRPPPGTPAFDVADLNIRFLPATGGAGATLSQPVAGLGFAGREPGPAATYVPRSQRGSRSCDSGGNPGRRWIGTWEAKTGNAVMTISISDHAVMGRIVTPDGAYRLDGTVNANGEIEADIEPSVAENGATLQGRFPVLMTSVDATGAEQYGALANLAFHLCS
jgi:hypothetical protein